MHIRGHIVTERNATPEKRIRVGRALRSYNLVVIQQSPNLPDHDYFPRVLI